MPINIQTAEDAWLEGKASFEEWRQQFEADWFEPLSASMWGMLFARMSPEEHVALRQMNPQAYDMISAIIKGGTNAPKNTV